MTLTVFLTKTGVKEANDDTCDTQHPHFLLLARLLSAEDNKVTKICKMNSICTIFSLRNSNQASIFLSYLNLLALCNVM